MKNLGDSLKEKKNKIQEELFDRHKYITKEFQDFGYRLAAKLGDTNNASMYIKFAKEKDRTLLEKAFRFTIDYPNAKSKKRIFLWKLKQLEQEAKEGKKQKDEGSDKQEADKKESDSED